MEKDLQKEKGNRFAMILIDNFQFGEDKDLKTMMLEAGYTEEELSEYNPIMKQATENIDLQNFVGNLNKKKRVALEFITKDKLKETSAKDLSLIVDTLNKTEQLLRGNATHRLELNNNFTNDERYRTILREALEQCEDGNTEELDELLPCNTGKVSGELAPPNNWAEATGSSGEGKEWTASENYN